MMGKTLFHFHLFQKGTIPYDRVVFVALGIDYTADLQQRMHGH
jgi:hypothetical protein